MNLFSICQRSFDASFKCASALSSFRPHSSIIHPFNRSIAHPCRAQLFIYCLYFYSFSIQFRDHLATILYVTIQCPSHQVNDCFTLLFACRIGALYLPCFCLYRLRPCKQVLKLIGRLIEAYSSSVFVIISRIRNMRLRICTSNRLQRYNNYFIYTNIF